MNKHIVIHISGASGSGKTTLGIKLKEHFGNKIVVKDIDDLRRDFIKEHYGNNKFDIIDKNSYQNYIDNFVKTHSKKTLIFVGLNHMPWWHKNLYYNMHSTYNYYIELDDAIILKQKCKRLLLEWANSEEDMEYLISNNKKYIENVSNALADECNLKKTNKMHSKWNKDYAKQGYKFMSRENIYSSIVKLLKTI